MKNLNFKELNLTDSMKKALDFMGFEESTPIQSKAIPVAMEGKDLIGQAQTGTGKTCAFGIPSVEMIDEKNKNIQVLVLCPTRELAIQVSDEIRNLCKYKNGIKTLAIYGGQPIDRQITALKGKPQIIVGTPGRVMDHMRRKTLKFNELKIAVLDEADEMLNMGFREDIEEIFSKMPEERQTLLFSATMPKGILEIAKIYMKNPEHIATLQKEVTINTIDQYYLEVKENLKTELLSRIIDSKNINLAIVFCNTKIKVDNLTTSLQTRGYRSEALHGDMKQKDRDRVMNKFRKGQVEILVATDVAARGIDVNDVEAVFNYDIPSDAEYYVHRIGRTGRAGKKGVSYSFVFGRDMYKLRDIERYTKSKIIRTKPPTVASIENMKLQKSKEELIEVLKEGGYVKYEEIIENILEELSEFTSIDVCAALFKMKFKDYDVRSFEESDLDNDFSINNRNKFKDKFRRNKNQGNSKKNKKNKSSDERNGNNNYKKRDDKSSNSSFKKRDDKKNNRKNDYRKKRKNK